MRKPKLPTNIRPVGGHIFTPYRATHSRHMCEHKPASVDLIMARGRKKKPIAAYCRACGTAFPRTPAGDYEPINHKLFECEHCKTAEYVDLSFNRVRYCSDECRDQAESFEEIEGLANG